MIYTANITTDKDTAKTELKTSRIKVTKGLVYKMEIYFPSGSAGLMGVAVFDGLYQVWPSSVGEFFVGEDQEIDFDDLYMMDSAPYEFQVYTYNEDDTHNHFLAVRIGLVSQDLFMARFLPQRSQAYLVKMLSKMADERDELARLQREQIESTVFEWMVSEQKKEKRKQKRADARERAEERGYKEFNRL